MLTHILNIIPRTLIVKRTLATLPPASTAVSSTGPRLSTTNTNTFSVVTGHHDHDSSLSSGSKDHHASSSDSSSEEASKKPYMVNGGIGSGFGGIPMGAFATSTPFEQH